MLNYEGFVCCRWRSRCQLGLHFLSHHRTVDASLSLTLANSNKSEKIAEIKREDINMDSIIIIMGKVQFSKRNKRRARERKKVDSVV